MELLKWTAATCALGLMATPILAQDANPTLNAPVKQDVIAPVKNDPVVAPKPNAPENANKSVMVSADEPAIAKPDDLPKKELEALPPKQANKAYLPTKDSPPLKYDSKATYPAAYTPYVAPKTFDVIASADGKTLHVVGRINAGIATALKAAIQKNIKVKTISLSSEGGALVEGLAMGHIIREFKLDTYVELHCSSACTFAFMAGKNRVISPNAKIGFHQSSSGASLYYIPKKDPTYVAGDLLMRNVYAAAKIDPTIIEQGLKTPATDLYLPTTQMLLSGNVATRLIEKDDARTAVGKWPSSDTFIEMLNKEPILQDVLSLRPQIYYRAASVVWNDEALGKKSYQTEDKLKATVVRLLLVDMEQYPDDLVDAYIQLENEMWKADPYGYSLDCGYGLTFQAPVIAEIEEKYSVRYRALLKSMAAIDVKPVEFSEATSAAAQARLMEFFGLMIANENYTALNVISDFCSKPSGYFAQLAKLPRAERLSYIRAAISSTKNASALVY